MDPDPIRQAFDKWERGYDSQMSPSERQCHRAGFEAGAKWAARESAKLCDEALFSLRGCEGWGIDERRRELRYLLNKIRKNFGVEGDSP